MPVRRPDPRRILAVPRDANPYQGLLYDALTRHGYRVRYLQDGRSATLAWLALPAELVWRRAQGWGTVHVHWVWRFAPPAWVPRRWRPGLGELWFRLFLGLAGVLGQRVVWTAHNVLPHEPVFRDDAAARRRLIARAAAVFAHTPAAAAGVAALGCPAGKVVRVPFGRPAGGLDPRVPAARTPGPLRVLFFGAIREYKGVDVLLRAAAGTRGAVQVRVVGACRDDALRVRLAALARDQPAVDLRFGFATAAELGDHVAWADLVALPFCAVTTSSSVWDALGRGRPVAIPDLPAFADLDSPALVRWDGSAAGLTAVWEALAGDRGAGLADLQRAAAAGAAALPTWDDVADLTAAALEGITPARRHRRPRR